MRPPPSTPEPLPPASGLLKAFPLLVFVVLVPVFYLLLRAQIPGTLGSERDEDQGEQRGEGKRK